MNNGICKDLHPGVANLGNRGGGGGGGGSGGNSADPRAFFSNLFQEYPDGPDHARVNPFASAQHDTHEDTAALRTMHEGLTLKANGNSYYQKKEWQGLAIGSLLTSTATATCSVPGTSPLTYHILPLSFHLSPHLSPLTSSLKDAQVELKRERQHDPGSRAKALECYDQGLKLLPEDAKYSGNIGVFESWQNIQANRVQALAKLELWERVVEEATRLIGIAARPTSALFK